MEISTNVRMTLPTLAIENLDELKARASEIASKSEGLVVTTETLTESKKERADLNKLRTAISDKRIEVKKEYLKPLEKFEADMNSVQDEVTRVWAEIDREIKEVEDEERKSKTKKIEKLIKEHGKGLPIEIEKSWLNKSMTEARLVKEIENKVFFIKQDQERRSRDKRAITDLCETHSIEPSGWLVLLETGATFDEVMDRLKGHIEEVKADRKYRAEEKRKVESAQRKEEPKEEALISQTVTITGTRAQFEKLKEFSAEVGIHIEAYKG